jgi:N-acetylglucosaminyldiphosphoundecaprenol N-acetyl-beta-D-mannosaminyltransferase
VAYSAVHLASSELRSSPEMQATLLPAAVNVDTTGAVTDDPVWDDLSRKVYCVLGLPIDSIDMAALLKAVEDAAARKVPFLLSTPNLAHLVISQIDAEFRETLLLSELCVVDGMPIVWMARLLGLPIRERVAGSDLFEALRAEHRAARQLKIFLFGGADGVGGAAAKALNETPGGLHCVGSIFPGYGTIEDMSQTRFIEEINASHADFLLIALGAKKGQLWLLRNHNRLQTPVRAHLGATINFAAGKIRRAPYPAQRLGFEWLWRIKEEPQLWRRYGHDALILVRLLLTRILPLAVRTRWQKLRRRDQGLIIKCTCYHDTITLSLSGAAATGNIDKAVAIFREAIAAKRNIVVEFRDICRIDARFIGLLFMLRKQAVRQGVTVKFIDTSARLGTIFRLYGADFLLSLGRPLRSE